MQNDADVFGNASEDVVTARFFLRAPSQDNSGLEGLLRPPFFAKHFSDRVWARKPHRLAKEMSCSTAFVNDDRNEDSRC